MSGAAARQTWSAESYHDHARFVSDLAGPVLEWLAPKPGERILDLGCGDGVLTEVVAKAGDRFLPRQLANRGDRLVFSNGILVLAGGATILIVAFGGDTTALIPLYAVGVFCAFTLSQTGMVVHHWRLREPGWRLGLAINATGAVATFVVLLVVLVILWLGA